ncbi:hypothetical protein PIB30_063772 [Stylosanthes scabra]|uniref:Uncharacterized protein n=1 Tax=Stylosanthes scabra TaxID=79078 RepID=A0ABU6WJQ9_9FABA|nr:hypothetical protein [Stylosanthes scabra]
MGHKAHSLAWLSSRRYVTLLINKADLDNAAGCSCIHGQLGNRFVHDIFVEWASNMKNLVLFIERG